jgi:hypothetical protein
VLYDSAHGGGSTRAYGRLAGADSATAKVSRYAVYLDTRVYSSLVP